MVTCPIPTLRVPPDELDALGEAAALGNAQAEARALAGLGALLWGIVLDAVGALHQDEILLEVFGDILRDTTHAVRRYRRGRYRLSTFVGATARKAVLKHRRRYMTRSGARPPRGKLDLCSRHFRPVATLSETTPERAPADLDGCIDAPAVAWRLAELVMTLPDTEREVVQRRFGLFGCQPETCQAIGDSLDLTGERVRQIEADALYRLGAGPTKRGGA